MKFSSKAILAALIVLAILGAVAAITLRQRVGDIRPATLPPASTPKLGDPVSLTVPAGFNIGRFAANISGARDLQFSTGGTLLVSQPGSGQVTALPDRDRNGTADEAKPVVSGLNKPHGLALHRDWLFVAEETQLSRYHWNESNLTASLDKVLFNLPQGGRHSTRSIAIDSNGRLLVSLGSTCDVCVEKHPWIGSVIVSDVNGATPRVFATGLRNAVFIAFHPDTNQLWGTEMGRDFLGDELPPDEINIIAEGKNYGWPYCFGSRIPDASFGGTAARCSSTESAVYNIPAHSAPLGLSFIDSGQFPTDWQGDLFVAYHGSWNRSTPTGYKVVRLKTDGQSIPGEEDFITGFTSGNQAIGRPVDISFDSAGSLYVSDDKAGSIYKVIKH
jgi:glucose/arabinose dehydrogenase